jgi:hypothetical protein
VACDKFIYIEIIETGEQKQSEPKAPSRNRKVKTAPPSENKIAIIDAQLIKLIKNSINDLANDTGWATLAEVGALIIKKKTDFDPRNYGFSKLTPLIRSLEKHFEIDEKEVENSHIKHIYVKNKK